MPQILLFTLAPFLAAIVGAGVTAWRRPGPQLVSAIQHFAAGVVFAAAASEILPDLKHAGAVWPVMIGGGAGIAVMLLIQTLEALGAEVTWAGAGAAAWAWMNRPSR